MRSKDLISITDTERELASFAVQDQSNYGACLEDLQLFAQLEDISGERVPLEMELLKSSSEFDLLDLMNGALPNQDTTEPKSLDTCKPKRAPPTRRNPKAGKDHICDVCNRRFSEAYNLRIHKMTHTDEKPHVCEDCGKGFRQLNKLRIHAVTHTAERPHKCDICDKGFRYANYLTVHRRLHTGEKPYPCLVKDCQISFHSIHARRVHTKLRHSAVTDPDTDHPLEEQEQRETIALSFTCPVCSRVLTDHCYLSIHLKRHYNQRDFACPQPHCSKRFFSASELKHHQIAHSQLRPFACPLCPARFLRKSNHKQHLKVHER
ncbi:zinc finger protein 239 [Drosophila eugracilis]|uniref:zinc finger protein 239 n=1 Tax=Drosophila eugracilis TaxID=29029 RepID=UPI0007E6EE8B|nr:zinc finger protein 239 [Drosophila eugracilis]XP_017064415.1 zinc finger protein 239 [Drosophila eugracilis]